MDQSDINNYVKKKTKKRSTDQLTLNASISSSSKVQPTETKKDIDALVNSVLLKYMTDQASNERSMNKEYKADLKALVPILSEYLENYILIGHDILGNEVLYFFAKNQNDKNAVNKLFADTFVKIMSQNGGNGSSSNI